MRQKALTVCGRGRIQPRNTVYVRGVYEKVAVRVRADVSHMLKGRIRVYLYATQKDLRATDHPVSPFLSSRRIARRVKGDKYLKAQG